MGIASREAIPIIMKDPTIPFATPPGITDPSALALIAKIAELRAQGQKIISLNIGEPDFGTPDYIKVAGIKAIVENFTKYTPTNGILDLRKAIQKKLKEDV